MVVVRDVVELLEVGLLLGHDAAEDLGAVAARPLLGLDLLADLDLEGGLLGGARLLEVLLSRERARELGLLRVLDGRALRLGLALEEGVAARRGEGRRRLGLGDDLVAVEVLVVVRRLPRRAVRAVVVALELALLLVLLRRAPSRRKKKDAGGRTKRWTSGDERTSLK